MYTPLAFAGPGGAPTTMDRSTSAKRLSRNRHAPLTMVHNYLDGVGWGGTAPPPALERLDVAKAMPSSLRLG
jgi:hypothetical protein